MSGSGAADVTVSVREARIEDLPGLVDLLADDPSEGGDLAPYAAAFARITADPGQVQAVAELGGQIVGTLALSIVPGLAHRGTTRAEIRGVHTLTSLRGRGIGEALLTWALDEGRARGATVAEVACSRPNEQRFYEQWGFAGGELHLSRRLDR